jgi:phosphoglycolate phosphatase
MAAGSAVPELRSPRAVLFDWDNTLVDAWKSIHAALNATLVSEDLPPWSLEETKARVRGSLRDTFPAMFGARWEEARDIFYGTLEAVHLDTVEPLPGAEALLRELSGQSAFLGVVSNKTGTYLRREAAHLGWDRMFRRLVGAADAAEDKPAAAPVRMALEGAPVEAGPDVWFVGDTATDMLCARNAGCVAILVREAAPGQGDGVDEALFSDLSPDLHVNDLGLLEEILTKLR